MPFDLCERPIDEAYRFGSFELRVSERLLTEAGRPIQLGSRALDILTVLIARAGEIVSNDSIIACVWPTTFVDAANLRVQVGRLRKALGDGQDGARYIVNVPVRGYCFVAPVLRGRLPPTRLHLHDADRVRDTRGVFDHVQA